MKVTYIEGEVGVPIVVTDGRLAIVTGLLPSEPVFVFRARDAGSNAAFDSWWRLVSAGFTQERADDAKASMQELIDWQARNPELVRLPD